MFKFRIWGTALLFCFLGFIAQTTNAQDVEIGDEDLKNYASVMDEIDVLKDEIKTDFNKMIKAEELMKGGRRFNEIKKAKGDETKLKELNVTEEGLAVYNKIQEAKTEKQKELSATYNTLIKEKIGVKKFKAIRDGLKSDEDMKEKYTAFKKELEEARAEESDDE